ncbi:MAG: hypothetical protein AAGH41_11000 [Pseudomonadota bacterium]
MPDRLAVPLPVNPEPFSDNDWDELRELAKRHDFDICELRDELEAILGIITKPGKRGSDANKTSIGVS